MSQKTITAAFDFESLIDMCYDYYDQRGFTVRRETPLHRSINWSPSVVARKGRQTIAIEIRAKPILPEFVKIGMRETRRILPSVKIYCAGPPPVINLALFKAELQRLGAGAIRISNGLLNEVFPPAASQLVPTTIKLPNGRVVKPTVILEADHPYEAYAKIAQIVASATKYVKLIDPYFKEKTLHYLIRASRNVELSVITCFEGKRGSEEAPFLAAASIFRRDKPKFSAKKSLRKDVHDRYIMTESENWVISQSVDALGTKFGIMSLVNGSDARKAVQDYFSALWRSGLVVI